MIDLWIFGITAAAALFANFWVCIKYRIKPKLKSALLLVTSSTSAPCAAKIVKFAFSVSGTGGKRLIEEDQTLGVALLMGAFCAAWIGVEAITTVLAKLIRKGKVRASAKKELPEHCQKKE